jgi:hypothetical protein
MWVVGIERRESRGAAATNTLQYPRATVQIVMDVVGIGRIEEEERGGGWSYSTHALQYHVGTVHARERQEDRRLGL